MKHSTLQQWLSWLETCQAQTKDESKLETVQYVARKLNLLPVTQSVIIVAGTNGKGSCVAICDAILSAQGYRVGSYYSPHLFNYNERIRINNQPVSDALICEAFSIIDNARENIDLSYFEFTTLAALYIFQHAALDAVILEVGIGGRLDTTNIIDADVSVITSIDLDHMQLLGDTREKIGLEKAGIFRSHRPAICGDAVIPNTVKKYATNIDAKLLCYQSDYFSTDYGNHWSWWNASIRYDDLSQPNLLLQNCATAIAALHHFPLKITEGAIRAGLKNVYLPGRFQIISDPIMTIYDVAHNPAATKLLALRLSQLPCSGKTFAVVGMLKDKDILGSLRPMLPVVDQWYLGGLPHKRGADAFLLAQQLEHDALLFNDVQQAYAKALANARPTDRIVVFGSFYTIGALCPVKSL